jgi:hypothetical protein
MDAPIWLNASVVSDLRWFADWVERLNGVHILGEESWSARDADLEIWCDASNFGLGFASAQPNIGYFFQWEDDPLEAQSHTYFFEELCVLCAVLWATQLPHLPQRLAVHSDLANTYATFNSLHAYGRYNLLLMQAIDSLLNAGIDLRVFHIPGKHNIIADALSHGQFRLACELQPGISIQSFSPPRDNLQVLHK